MPVIKIKNPIHRRKVKGKGEKKFKELVTKEEGGFWGRANSGNSFKLALGSRLVSQTVEQTKAVRNIRAK